MSDADPARPRPRVVGLCGGVGAGKSTVAAALAADGALVLDADALVHQVLATPSMRAQLGRDFGPGILATNGEVDRRALAQRVFGPTSENTAARRLLESRIHPEVRAHIVAAIDAARASSHPPPLVVIDAPLLIEGPLASLCDAIVFVDAPAERRRAWTRGARQWDATEHDAREAAQSALETKRARASHVLVNDADGPTLVARTRALFAELTGPRPPP